MRYYFEPTPNGVGTYDILDDADNLVFRVVERGDADAAVDLLNDG